LFNQVEGYKLYIPVYYSNFTGKWEVSGLLFLSTETREKVDAGIRFFKQSLPYKIDGGSKFIFFTDKDFDYITVRILGFVIIFFDFLISTGAGGSV
jgi:hypothetical protein